MTTVMQSRVFSVSNASVPNISTEFTPCGARVKFEYKMKILVFNRHYLPGFKAGGPIRSLANLIALLGPQIEFYLITTDRDLLDEAPFPGLPSEGWVTVGLAKVRYLSASEISMKKLQALVNEIDPDAIYLNSFFDPIFSLRILAALWRGWLPRTQLLIAPRGEFSPDALALHWLKKANYVALFNRLRLSRRVFFHASTGQEAADIMRVVKTDPTMIKIAPDLCRLVNAKSNWQPRAAGDALRVCFLSRISPKKNLLGALAALGAAKTPSTFDIYGPTEDRDYWLRCQSAIAKLPPHVEVNYRGVVTYEDVAATIARYDLFLFPTHGENFGHAIIEALGMGVPVLISNSTPWNDLQAFGAGWAVSGGAADYAAYIDEAAARKDHEQLHFRRQSAAYADRVLRSEIGVAQNVALFDLIPGATTVAYQLASRHEG